MNYAVLITAILILSCSNPSVKEERNTNDAVLDEQKEQAAIIKVIEKETECFFQRDYNCWQSCFAQTDYAFQAWNNENGTFDAFSGWEAVNNHAAIYLKNNPVTNNKDMGQEYSAKETRSSHPKVIRKNMKTKFFSDKLAYLVWDQYNSDTFSQRFTWSKDSRLMEKIDGEWKIVNVTSYWDFKNPIPADSLQ